MAGQGQGGHLRFLINIPLCMVNVNKLMSQLDVLKKFKPAHDSSPSQSVE